MMHSYTATAIVDGQRYFARIRQFPTTAYVEVWGDHGFDIECNTPLDDVRSAMTDDNRGRLDVPR